MMTKTLSAVLALSLALSPAVHANGIVVDPAALAAQQAVMDAAQNGVPVQQIAPPSAAGVSHNKFQEFNVATQGLILNNSLEAAVSQLGGAIDANARLGGRAADLVLNEVTGVGRTSLNGFTEMFGHRADYILANPNGITCDGCGFINIPRATLGTGVPTVDPLAGFTGMPIAGGDVLVGPGGLDASRTDYFTILTRSATVNGPVWGGNDFYLRAGADVPASPLPQTYNGAVSIDASALGSIYAGRIELVSTEAGVGVNLQGLATAAAGDLVLSSNGSLTHAQLNAARDLVMEVNETEGYMNSAGASRAGRYLLASGGQSLSFGSQATLLGGAGVAIRSGVLHLDGGGYILSGGDLILDIGRWIGNDNGLFFARNDIDITAGESINNRGGQIFSFDGDISIRKRGADSMMALNNQSGRIEAYNGDVFIDAYGLSNAGNPVYTYESAGGILLPGANAKVLSITTVSPSSIKAGGDLTIHSVWEAVNRSSSISAGGDIEIIASDIFNVRDFHDNNYICTPFMHCAPPPDISVAYPRAVKSDVESSIKAGGLLTLQATTGQSYQYAFSSGNQVHVKGDLEVGAPGGTSGPGPGNTVSLADFGQINQGYASLFTINADPGSRYLIVTDPLLLDLAKFQKQTFQQTDAFLKQIEVDLTTLAEKKIYGDDLYTAQLLGDAALKWTGARVFLEDATTEADQFTTLLSNAAAAKTDLQLSFGVALTGAQIAELQEPIIWYVVQTKGGQEVYAPVLYLPQATLAGLTSGPRIEGKDILLEGGDVKNRGRIAAKNNLMVAAKSVFNQGTAARGADGRVTTAGGQMSAGKDLIARTEGDFTNQGAAVSAGRNAVISSGGDVTFGTAALTETSTTGIAYGTSKTTTITNVGSTLTAGGALAVESAGDVSLIGSAVHADGPADVAAAGSVKVAAAQDSTTTETEQNWTTSRKECTSRFLWWCTETRTVVEHHSDSSSKTTTTNVASALSSGGDLALRSGADIGVTGSSLLSGGNALLMSGADVDIRAGQNTSDTSSSTRDRSRTVTDSWGLFSSEVKETVSDRMVEKRDRAETAVASQVAAAGDLTVVSGGDVRVEGSDLKAGENLAVSAGRDLLLLAGADKTESFLSNDHKTSETVHKESGFEFLIFKNKTTTDIRNDSHVLDVSLEASELARVSSLVSGGGMTLLSGGNALLQGTAVTAAGDLGLAAAGRLDLLAAQDSFSSSHDRQETRSAVFKEVHETSGIGLKFYGDAETVGGVPIAVEAGFKVGLDKTTTVTQSRSDSAARDTSTDESTKARVVSLAAGGDALLSAGTDALLEGARVQAGDRSVIFAANDLAVTAARDTVFHQETATYAVHEARSRASQNVFEGVGLGGGVELAASWPPLDFKISLGWERTETNERSAEELARDWSATSAHAASTAQTASLTGATVQVGASRDAALEGASLQGAQGVSIAAGRDVTLTAAMDEESRRTTATDSTDREKTRSWDSTTDSKTLDVYTSIAAGYRWGNESEGASSSDRWTQTSRQETETTETRARGVSLQGGDVALSAGRDASLQSAHLEGGAVIVQAADDLSMTAAQETSSSKTTRATTDRRESASSSYQGEDRNEVKAGVGASGPAYYLTAKWAVESSRDAEARTSLTERSLAQTTEERSSRAVAAGLAGDRVALLSGGDTALEGARIDAAQSLAVSSGGGLAVTAARDESVRTETHVEKETRASSSSTVSEESSRTIRAAAGVVGYVPFAGVAAYGGAESAAHAQAAASETSLESTSEQKASLARAAALSSGGDLLLRSQEDLRLEGAGLSSAGDTLVQGRDVALSAAHDERSRRDTSTTSEKSSHDQSRGASDLSYAGGAALPVLIGFLGGGGGGLDTMSDYVSLQNESTSAQTDASQSSTVRRAEASAGGSIYILADRDAALESTRLAAQGDAEVRAGRDLSVTAAQDTAARQVTRDWTASQSIQSGGTAVSVSGGGGAIGVLPFSVIGLGLADAEVHAAHQDFSKTVAGSASDRSNAATAVTADLSGRNVGLTAFRDASLEGASLAAEEKASILALRDVSFTAAQDTASRQSEFTQTTDASSLFFNAHGEASAGALGLAWMSFDRGIRADAMALVWADASGEAQAQGSVSHTQETLQESSSAARARAGAAQADTMEISALRDIALEGTTVDARDVHLQALRDVSVRAVHDREESSSKTGAQSLSATFQTDVAKVDAGGWGVTELFSDDKEDLIDASGSGGAVFSGHGTGNASISQESRSHSADAARGASLNGSDTLRILSGRDIALESTQAEAGEVQLGAGRNIAVTAAAGSRRSTSDSLHASVSGAGTLALTTGAEGGLAGVFLGQDKTVDPKDADVSGGAEVALNLKTAGTVRAATSEEGATAHAASRINASGPVTAAAVDNIALTNAHITSGGPLSLTAGDHLTVGAAADSTHAKSLSGQASLSPEFTLTEKVGAGYKGGELNVNPDWPGFTLDAIGVDLQGDMAEANRTTHQGSSLTSGQGVLLASDKDMTISGSRVKAAHDAALVSGGALTVASVQDTSSAMAAQGAVGFDYKEDASREAHGFSVQGGYAQSAASQNVASSVQAGGNLAAASETDMTIRGSRLAAGGNVAAKAGGNLSILSGESTSHALSVEGGVAHTSEEDKTTGDVENRWALTGAVAAEGAQTHEASTVEAGQNAVLHAQGDATLDASQIKAGDTASLTAEKKVTLGARINKAGSAVLKGLFGWMTKKKKTGESETTPTLTGEAKLEASLTPALPAVTGEKVLIKGAEGEQTTGDLPEIKLP